MKTSKLVTIPPINLIGMKMNMSLANNQTGALWGGFMPRRTEILNATAPDLYSIQLFDENMTMEQFSPQTVFEKWAAVPVADFDQIPDGMEKLTLKGGLYAVFIHQGPAHTFRKTFEFIHSEWMPSSKYQLDHRAHFEIMGADYLGINHPDSEEEVWIPVKGK